MKTGTHHAHRFALNSSIVTCRCVGTGKAHRASWAFQNAERPILESLKENPHEFFLYVIRRKRERNVQ